MVTGVFKSFAVPTRIDERVGRLVASVAGRSALAVTLSASVACLSVSVASAADGTSPGAAVISATPAAPAVPAVPAAQVQSAVEPSAERIQALVSDMSNTRSLWALYKQKSYAEALHAARPLAEQGSPSAQYVLAMLYAGGHGVSQDADAATRWLKRAAEQYLPDAWEQLGMDYRRRETTDERRALGRDAYARSAAANVAIARYQKEHTNPMQFATARGDGAARRYWEERERYFTRIEALYRGGRPTSSYLAEPMRRLPVECRPARPPLNQMRALGTTQTEGSLDIYIDKAGRVDGVSIHEISDERLRLVTFDLFNNALQSTGCVFPGSADIRARVPFRFSLR